MSTTHPQVGAYLDDLARMLSDVDPGERDDILASVREHLDAEIGERGGADAVVHAALLRLGPPERVAAEARAGQPARPSPPERRPRSRAWVRVAVVLTLLTTVPFVLDVLLTQMTILSAELFGTPYDSAFGMFGPTGVFMPLVSPVWVVALVAVLLAPNLSTTTRAWLIGLGPLSFGVVLLATFWRSPPVVSIGVCVVLLLAVLAALVVVTRRAWRDGHTPT